MSDINDGELLRAGDAVKLVDCPIGLFVSSAGNLCLKTEYGNNEGRIDAYIVSSGEFFWGAPPQTIMSQRAQMVRPVEICAARPPSAEVVEALAKQLCEACGLDWGEQASALTSASGADDEQEHYRLLAETAVKFLGSHPAPASGWRTIDSAPKDGTPIVGPELYRYLPYKTDGKRQMKAAGRWQRHNGYGWENAVSPSQWMPAAPAKEGR